MGHDDDRHAAEHVSEHVPRATVIARVRMAIGGNAVVLGSIAMVPVARLPVGHVGNRFAGMGMRRHGGNGVPAEFRREHRQQHDHEEETDHRAHLA